MTGEDRAKKIVNADYIEGFASKDNLRAWSERARENSFHQDKAEARHNIGTEGCDQDIKEGLPELPRQKRSEGQGWAEMKRTTADNTYTGKGGSKRE